MIPVRQPRLHASGGRSHRISIRRLVPLLVVAALLIPVGGTGASDELELSGEVVVEHGDDFAGRRAHEFRYLDTRAGRFVLEGPRAQALLDGARVRVRGNRHGATLVLGADSTVTALATGSVDAFGAAGVTATAATQISKRVAVLLVNFTSPMPSPTPSPTPSATSSPSATPSPTPSPSPSPSPSPTAPQPWTLASVRDLYFNRQRSVASYFAEVSNGQLTMTGDVFGYFTLAVSTSKCNYSDWGLAARQAAAAAGVDLAGYTNVVHAFPRQSSCGWGGLGQLPGRYSWINGSMSLYVTSHELGHNFGAHHASTLRCTQAGVRVQLSSSCTVDEYGDPFDVMGTSAQRHVQSWHRRQLGFLGTADQLTVTQSGQYRVATAQVAGGTPRILRVPRASGDFYYLEFRQPYGLFDNFSTTLAAVNGVMVRIAPDVKRVQSRLIDMTPATTSFSDAALAVGQTFTDAAGISITTLSVGSSGATVRVQLGPDTAAPATPAGFSATSAGAGDVQLSWQPASDDVGVTGYRLTRDGVEVASTTGTTWTDTNLRQGATYQYGLVALDAARNASGPATLSHFLPDTTPPSAPGSATATPAGPRSVSVGWQAATDNVGVTGYEVRRDGVLLTTTTGTSLADAVPMDGFTYRYAVRALDAAGNAGASTLASVALPDVTSPSAPGALAATAASATSTSLSWQPATDNVAVAGYRVSRDGVHVANVGAGATTFAESGLASDRTYAYSVAALDAAGNAGPRASAQVQLVSLDTIAPSVPQGLRGEPLGRRRVSLTWKPSTDDRAGTIQYRVFRNDRLIATVTTTSYVDRPAAVGWYSYKVRAIDTAGNRSAFTPGIRVKAVRYV